MSDTTKHVSVRRYPLAIMLWIIVGTGLLYGVSQTVVKASALFTG
jgi:hypothetical protein